MHTNSLTTQRHKEMTEATVVSTIEVNSTVKPQNTFCNCGKCRLQDNNDCTKFYECINNVYVTKQCAVGYLFSNSLVRCEIADKVECDKYSELCLKDDGFFADANDCSSYIQCYHGISYNKTCSEGLLYNPVKRTCDINSNCGVKPILPTSRNMEIDCDCNYCIMGDSDDCTKYYLCLDGVAYTETCSDGLRFNSETSACDYEESAICASSSPKCETKNGDFPFPENCSLYYHCVGGVAYEKECMPGFHFSATTGQCEGACEAGCDSSLECPVTSELPMCQDRDDFFPNPDDCHTFYECSEGEPKLAECTDGEHFNAVEKSCQDPCQAMCDLDLDCLNSTTAYTDSSTPASTSSVTNSTSSLITFEETKISDPNDITSTSFSPISRTETTATERDSSSDGTAVHLYSSVHPEPGDDELMTESTSRTTRYVSSLNLFTDETTEIFPTTFSAVCLEPTGVYPDPEECRALYLCTDGYPMKLYCDGHLHFNPLTKVCESPCSALCDPDLDCSTTEEPDTPTPLPLSLCRTKDFLPKRGYCRYYYDCTRSKLQRKKRCPKGLEFNPTKRVCDLPQESGCGKPVKDLLNPDLIYECPCETCLLPSTENCLEYFLCLNFTAYRMKCSDGLLFDKTQNTCNFATQVICDTSIVTTSSPYPSTEEIYTTARPPYTTQTSPTTISYTTTGQPYTKSMSSTSKPYTTRPTTSKPYTTRPTTSRPYTTSSTTSRPITIPTTNRPYTTKPTTSRPYTTKPTTNRPYTTKPTTNRPYTTSSTTSRPYSTKSPTKSPFRCPEASGMFRNPKDCGSFIHCSNFIPYFKKCPDGLHFNTEMQRCDYPCASKCDGSLACVTSSPIPPTTLNPLCPCRNCLRPNPESCTKFFDCKDGQPTKRDCPRGQTFDTRLSGCDWAHRVDCQHSEICPKRNGLFPYKGDCGKFVRCSNGIPYTKVCPKGLQFDPETLRCTYASGPCGSAPSTNGTRSKSKQPAPGAARWRCPGSFGYYRHEGKCNQYYFCSKGVAHLKECPEGLYFNSKYGTCDWQKDVNCRVDQSPLEKKCRHFTEDLQCPDNRSFVANSHCDMFFDCRTGKGCAKKCPYGLYFNSETLMCDLPSNVRCRKRDGGSYSLKRFAEVCRHGYKVQEVDPVMDRCYYECLHYKLRRFCCGGSRIYNVERGKCERRASFYLPFESQAF